MNIKLILILVILLTACAPINNSISLEIKQPPTKIFILAGQSNMVGRAGLIEDDFNYFNENILVFGNDYQLKIAYEPIDNGDGQIDIASYDKRPQFGPSMPFGIAMSTYLNQKVILVPCALGGSSISQWERPKNPLDTYTLYGSLVNRALIAKQMSNGIIAGVIWFQGEKDAVSYLDTHSNYLNLFIKFATNIRIDLRDSQMPFIYAQLGPQDNNELFTYWDDIKAQQEQAQYLISNSKMIKTDDLTIFDYVHFTHRSYELIGQRFAEAFIKVDI
ncbi:hypothetical protein LCGC14_0405630 [marine sediment metagenome]|uniref:Sialate O-acetylesterase domain-containing protein n=1 Tax=marine sediment metagenome TaxID=412755 RepID=A0A0F9T183_9ZZZZ